MLPHIAGPRDVGFAAGNAVFFTVQVAHMAFNGRTAPYQLTGLRIAGFNLTHNTEFSTRYTSNDHAFSDKRRRGVGVTRFVIT